MRSYLFNPLKGAEIIEVSMWLYGLRKNFFDETDGVAIWMKNGLECGEDAFSTEPLDATHVAWYYEENYRWKRIKRSTYLLVPISKIENKIGQSDKPEEVEILNDLLSTSKTICLDIAVLKEKALHQYPNFDIKNNECDNCRYLGYKQAILDLIKSLK